MAGTLITYIDVPQASFRTIPLPRPAIGVLVDNGSNVAVTIQDDLLRGQDTPAGITLGYNFPEGVSSPRVGCVGSYQGRARVWFYDGSLDLSNNPPIQQPPGSITLSGNVTVVFDSAQPVIFSGTQPVSLSGNVNLAPGTSILATDLLVETNTGTLTGLLPSANGVATIVAPSGLFTYTVPNHPIVGFALTVWGNGSGLYDVYVVTGGQTIYLDRSLPFIADVNGIEGLAQQYTQPVPTNGTINIHAQNMSPGGTLAARVFI